MKRPRRPVTGRPEPGEYADYAQEDLDQVPGEDAVEALLLAEQQTLELYGNLTEEQIAGLRYAPGKWTPKEILGHLADDERIFVYRALAIARGTQKS